VSIKTRNRFPDTHSILSVYAVIAFGIYTWTIITFFRQLPSRILFLSAGEIGGIFAYAMTMDLFESLLWLGLLLLVAFLLPPRMLRDKFLVRAGWFILVFLISLVLYLIPGLKLRNLIGAWIWLTVSILPALFAAWLSSRVSLMERIIGVLSDRTLVMLIIYFPMSIISFVFVVYRLVFLD
jgi:hypothetical protein